MVREREHDIGGVVAELYNMCNNQLSFIFLGSIVSQDITYTRYVINCCAYIFELDFDCLLKPLVF